MQFTWDNSGENRKRVDLRLDCDPSTGATTIHDLKSGNSQDFDTFEDAIQYIGQQSPQS
jgi:hypothetical protein